MRAVLGACALVCLLGGVTAAVETQWGTAAAWAFGFWLAYGWFVAVVTANRAVDDAINEVRPDREYEK